MGNINRIYHAYQSGRKSLADLTPTNAYETNFTLAWPVEDLEAAREHLKDDPKDPTSNVAYTFMNHVFDDADDPEDMTEAGLKWLYDVVNGLVNRIDFELDTEQTGHVRVEATRPISDSDLKDISYFVRCQCLPGNPGVSERLSTFTGHNGDKESIINADEHDFRFHEVPLMPELGDALDNLQSELDDEVTL